MKNRFLLFVTLFTLGLSCTKQPIEERNEAITEERVIEELAFSEFVFF